ncbi:hypothetical protein MCFN_01735 [Mycoplasmopsis californica]|uniref:Uncharacterized protein n=1 Tax=Mycoplasmopsis californica TaxID=2113 RepID=A0A059XR12_9BACT|nr:hypothetical protein [Mycoplasmopsis californica]AIA29490.1 hypothetical protein MCFN_01735 [Mycoplasmopsis californica]
MELIVIKNHKNAKTLIQEMENQLDNQWELGAQGAILQFSTPLDINVWDVIVKYFQQNNLEFSFKIIEEYSKISVEFVI